MKIRGMLVSGALGFLALLALILGMTVRLLTAGGGDAQYINFAGRQRMLSQKLSKEVLMYQLNPTPKNLDAVDKTALIFDRTHKALRNGGRAPSKLDNTEDVEVAANPALATKLDEVGADWEQLSGAVQKLKTASAKRAEALTKIAEINPGLLSVMDQATALYGPKDGPHALNVAGRQRMLSQKLGKEALLFAQSPTPELRQALQESMILFNRSHKALRYGGETTVAGQTVGLDPALSPPIVAKLDGADKLWKEMESALNVLLSEGTAPEAMATFYEVNPRVLKAMDEATTIAQTVSEQKVRVLQNAQLGAMAAAIILVFGTIYLASKIGGAIASLQKAAEEISVGQVNQPVEVKGIGELKHLAAAFERMRISLSMAVEQLEESADSAASFKAAPPSTPAVTRSATRA